jgi:hypothetical protein
VHRLASSGKSSADPWPVIFVDHFAPQIPESGSLPASSKQGLARDALRRESSML